MIVIDEATDWPATLHAMITMGRITQAELARTSGYTDQQISNWMRGVKQPGRVAAIRLGAALGYDLAYVPREDA